MQNHCERSRKEFKRTPRRDKIFGAQNLQTGQWIAQGEGRGERSGVVSAQSQMVPHGSKENSKDGTRERPCGCYRSLRRERARIHQIFAGFRSQGKQ